MTISKTRYFKIQEIETGTFQMLETQDGRFIQVTQIDGLETRCKMSKVGFHFWVFLPDKINVLKCLACGNVAAIPTPKPKTPPTPPETHMPFAQP